MYYVNLLYTIFNEKIWSYNEKNVNNYQRGISIDLFLAVVRFPNLSTAESTHGLKGCQGHFLSKWDRLKNEGRWGTLPLGRLEITARVPHAGPSLSQGPWCPGDRRTTWKHMEGPRLRPHSTVFYLVFQAQHFQTFSNRKAPKVSFLILNYCCFEILSSSVLFAFQTRHAAARHKWHLQW